jgi:hypothetical protein
MTLIVQQLRGVIIPQRLSVASNAIDHPSSGRNNNNNRASSAAPQHSVAAPDRAPNYVLFHLNLFSLIHSNWALGAAPQQGVEALDGAPEFFIIIIIMIYFNLFES